MPFYDVWDIGGRAPQIARELGFGKAATLPSTLWTLAGPAFGGGVSYWDCRPWAARWQHYAWPPGPVLAEAPGCSMATGPTATATMTSGEWSTAQVALDRLVELDPDSQNARYQLALALGESGDAEQCQAIMEQLASPASGGYRLAHLWLARQVVQSRPDLTSTIRACLPPS